MFKISPTMILRMSDGIFKFSFEIRKKCHLILIRHKKSLTTTNSHYSTEILFISIANGIAAALGDRWDRCKKIHMIIGIVLTKKSKLCLRAIFMVLHAAWSWIMLLICVISYNLYLGITIFVLIILTLRFFFQSGYRSEMNQHTLIDLQIFPLTSLGPIRQLQNLD